MTHLVENDVAQVRRQRRRLLRVLVNVGDEPAVRALATLVLLVAVLRSRLKVRQWRELGHVDKVVHVPFDVCDRELVRGKAPLVVDDKLVRVLAAREVRNVRKVVPRPVHRALLRPAVERASDVHIAAAVLPAKDHRDYVRCARRAIETAGRAPAVALDRPASARAIELRRRQVAREERQVGRRGRRINVHCVVRRVTAAVLWICVVVHAALL